MSRKLRHILLLSVPVLAAGFATLSCSGSANDRPNVLWVVWDTTRADQMSLYGFDKPTTPFLEEWAKKALVFDDCTSTGSSTVPSHGAMFTGLLPSEHGANNRHHNLDGRLTTLAELFRRSGYSTFLWAANPHISSEEGFAQGFDVEHHPWDELNKPKALEILRSKVSRKDQSSEIVGKIIAGHFREWDIKAAGELGVVNLLNFLEKKDSGKPFYAFLNYMEAHRPFVPPEKFRQVFMTPEQVDRSYKVDRSWIPMWSYTFGLKEYTPEELQIMALTYDACIAELDSLFKDLIQTLDSKGYLDNTIVVLTGDHGEHLGEHHMLDHQFSLYQGLVHVPLVLYFPHRIKPGRVEDPVQNYDIFPTLLELADLQPPKGLDSKAVSLLHTSPNRVRLSEYPSDMDGPLLQVKKLNPSWDPTPFQRRLKALYQDHYKFILGSDGKKELYNLQEDPDEKVNLAKKDPAELEKMMSSMGVFVKSLNLFHYDSSINPELSQEQKEMLAGLGYVDGDAGSDSSGKK